MRLKNPEFLLFLLAWIPMVWVYLRREKKLRPSVRFSDLSIVKKTPSSPLLRLRHVPLVLRMVAVGLLAVALARPQKGQTEEEVSTEGVDIMLTLDVSTSMRALDFKPENRLFVAKETLKGFIGKRHSDRMGLVVYAGRSYTKCPMTLDYNVLIQFLETVQSGEIEDGTAIGTAIATAATRIKDSPAKSKVMILISDGANNRGDIAPAAAAQAAGQLGIKIYTIGVGKEGQIPYPFEGVNPWTGQPVTQVQMIQSDLDEKTLQDVADATGGKFFRARDPEALQQIMDTIDKLEKTEIKTKSYTSYSDKFFVWLLLGAALLLAEIALANTRLRRIP
jgi:Ca-activated chloride channel family protein